MKEHLKNFTVRPYKKYNLRIIIYTMLALLMTAMTMHWIIWRNEIFGNFQLVVFLSPILAFVFGEIALQYTLALYRRRIIVDENEITYIPKCGKRKVFTESDVSNVVIHVKHPGLASMGPGVKLFPTKYIEIYLYSGKKIRFSAKYINSDLLVERFQSKKIPLKQRDRVR